MPLTVAGADGHAQLQVGRVVTEGLHQVDSPAFDAQGRLHVTYSGARGQQVPVSVFRIDRDGGRESLVTGLVNPTALAFGPDGRSTSPAASKASSTRWTTAATTRRRSATSASPAAWPSRPTARCWSATARARSSASCPTATRRWWRRCRPRWPRSTWRWAPTAISTSPAPTLTARDHVYRVSLDGKVEVAWSNFGRPQGLAFGPDGALYIVEALSGASGLYRVELESTAPPQLVLSGAGLVGVAFDPLGGVVVASNDTAWRLEKLPIDPDSRLLGGCRRRVGTAEKSNGAAVRVIGGSVTPGRPPRPIECTRLPAAAVRAALAS